MSVSNGVTDQCDLGPERGVPAKTEEGLAGQAQSAQFPAAQVTQQLQPDLIRQRIYHKVSIYWLHLVDVVDFDKNFLKN